MGAKRDGAEVAAVDAEEAAGAEVMVLWPRPENKLLEGAEVEEGCALLVLFRFLNRPPVGAAEDVFDVEGVADVLGVNPENAGLELAAAG